MSKRREETQEAQCLRDTEAFLERYNNPGTAQQTQQAPIRKVSLLREYLKKLNHPLQYNPSERFVG